MVETREALVAHVGGKPNAGQAIMIHRIVMTLMRLELMDRNSFDSDTPGEIISRQARDQLAWENTVNRLIESLNNIKPASDAN